jgi:hypothetical protein
MKDGLSDMQRAILQAACLTIAPVAIGRVRLLRPSAPRRRTSLPESGHRSVRMLPAAPTEAADARRKRRVTTQDPFTKPAPGRRGGRRCVRWPDLRRCRRARPQAELTTPWSRRRLRPGAIHHRCLLPRAAPPAHGCCARWARPMTSPKDAAGQAPMTPCAPKYAMPGETCRHEPNRRPIPCAIPSPRAAKPGRSHRR